MGNNLVKLPANLAAAKANLSKYLRRVKAGETILIRERNVPIAELRRLQPGWEISSSFFEPLPDDGLDAFEGD